MEEEEANNSAGYLIIIAALKARKAKLKDADSQLRKQILDLQEEILMTQQYNKSQDYCNCPFAGDTSVGPRTAIRHVATNMQRTRCDVMFPASGLPKLVPPTPTLER